MKCSGSASLGTILATSRVTLKCINNSPDDSCTHWLFPWLFVAQSFPNLLRPTVRRPGIQLTRSLTLH
jgi:hypothetical protein